MKKRIVSVALASLFALASTYAQTTDFFELAKSGTPQEVQAAIDQGADVRAWDDPQTERTPLMLAAAYNPNPEVITTLLKAWAGLKDRDESSWTALMWAAKENQNAEMITTLLKAGADLEARDKNGWTSLMWAAKENQNAEVITALLKAGADLEAQSNDRMTALLGAAEDNQNPEVITTLLKAGADLEAQNNLGMTALLLVAKSNPNPEVIITLLKAGADAKVKDSDGKTVFYYAQCNGKLKGTDALRQLQEQATDFFDLVQYGTPRQVLAAIKKGANILARDVQGRTALMYAAECNPNAEVITTLLKAGAKVDAGDEYSTTALMYAAECNPNPEVVTTLLKAGAKVNARNEHAMTALLYAAENNQNPEVITTLLKAGADLKVPTHQNRTALMLAAESNPNPEVITTLLEAGADVTLRGGEGEKTAFDYAQDNEKLKGTDAYQQLQEATITRPNIFDLVQTGTAQDIQDAISKGADLNARNGNDDTPLMYAAECNKDPEVIATLVKAGADPKARGGISFQDYQQKNISFMVENYTFAIPNTNHNVGKTALMYAAEYNQNPEVITTLLKAGADLEAQDKTGMTALMYAAAANPIPEVITVLLKAGADVNAQIKTQFVYIKGMTALMHAASCNQNPDVITTLLKAGANAKAKDKNGKTALYYAKNNRKLKGTAALRQLQKVSQ